MGRRSGVVYVCLAATLLVASELERYTPAERRHWAFQPRRDPEIPKFSGPADRAWAKSPLDALVLQRLRKEGLRPAPKADRATLIRRMYLDLLGLPPSPREVDAFVLDKSPRAVEKLVDSLLASPHYGERWGGHWLDVVRFAESDGFEYDTHRNDAWRYRDYVIRSFNADKPYDQFLREQLAGDQIDPANDEYLVAAGFHRLGPLRKNAGNQEVASSRNEVLTEMTNVIGSALLGVTLGCARCHDHKFDPIRQKDYYRIQAYFAATQPYDRTLASAGEQQSWKAKTDAIQAEMKSLQAKMRGLTGGEKTAMEQKIKEIEATLPPPLPALYSVADDPAKVTPIHVLARGDYQNKGERVGIRPLGVLLEDGAPEQPPTAKPRTELANWILTPGHPLTARVIVNRIWHYHFGRGIVSTPNDFGRMGARPTHPELLDWLANRFVENGWRMKPIHRMILLSSAYQQSSRSPLAAAKDPENTLLWKFSRRRLEAEEIRDAMLAAAGALNPKTGGPSVIVPVDPELINLLYKPSQWAVTPDAAEHNRRSIYLIAKRNLRLPFFEVFDAPDLQSSCPRRESSTHPPQALELLNGRLSNRMAELLAERLRTEAATPASQVDLAYRLVTGRAPSPRQKDLALTFLANNPLREFALAMFNLNQFLYVD
ncbi:MAG: DUF1553 domain-containing protein [Acidobacteria bacterium]|nr:DUF1553 domain-containing protein [Acidobacteriota bacterium]